MINSSAVTPLASLVLYIQTCFFKTVESIMLFRIGKLLVLLYQYCRVCCLLLYLQLNQASQAAAGHFNVDFVSLTNEEFEAYNCHNVALRVARRAAYASVLFRTVI